MHNIWLVAKSQLSQLASGSLGKHETLLRKTWSSIVGRRALHFLLQRAEGPSAIDQHVTALPENKAMLEQVHQLTTQVNPGSIYVEGNMNAMTTSDWLNLEQQLAKALISAPNRKQVSMDALLHRVKSDTRPLLHPFLRKIQPLKTTRSDIALGFTALALSAAATAGLMFPLGFLAKVSFLSTLAYVVLGGSVCTMVGLTVTLATATSEWQAEMSQMRSTFLEELSTTWDSVLETKTMADAVLVGMLTEVLLVCMKNSQDTPSAASVVPNILAGSPAQAFELCSYLYSFESVFEDKCANMMNITAELSGSLADQPEKVVTPTHVVDGIDFSTLMANTITLPQANPEPVPERLHVENGHY